MKFHDSAIGVLLIVFGLWIVWTARDFPQLIGQPIGPGTFPVVLGVLCALGGAGIALQGLISGGPLLQLQSGWRKPDRIITAFVMIAGTAILAAKFEKVGFPIGGSLLLMALFFATGKRHPAWFLLAVGFVGVVHVLLTRFLHVPLPIGLLKGVL